MFPCYFGLKTARAKTRLNGRFWQEMARKCALKIVVFDSVWDKTGEFTGRFGRAAAVNHGVKQSERDIEGADLAAWKREKARPQYIKNRHAVR